MSEGSPETVINRNVDAEKDDETTKDKRGSKTSKSLSNLAKEAKAILKGFNEKEEVPEGRRATRSSTRSSAITPISTPPPAKRDKKSVSPITSGTSNAGRGTKRGRPKKSASEHTKTDVSFISDDKNYSVINEKLTADKGSEKIETPKNDDPDNPETKSSEDRTCMDSSSTSLADGDNTKELGSTETVEAANKSLTTNGSSPQETLKSENVENKCESKITSSNSEKTEEISQNTVISDEANKRTESMKSCESEKSQSNSNLDTTSSNTISSND